MRHGDELEARDFGPHDLAEQVAGAADDVIRVPVRRWECDLVIEALDRVCGIGEHPELDRGARMRLYELATVFERARDAQ